MPSGRTVRWLAVLLAAVLAGCATAPAAVPTGAAAAGAATPGAATPGAAEPAAAAGVPEPPEPADEVGTRSARIDPFEPFNRAVWAFNEALDDAVLKPLTTFYDRYTPEVIRLIVGNVLSNLLDPYIAVNNLLQGKPSAAASDVGRFLLNSTFGFFGFGDPASDMGLRKNREDFGQTLGVWGVPTGPYLVLPLFGPSNVRDGIGLAVDMAASLDNRFASTELRASLAGFGVLEARARLLPAERLLADAFDRYLLVRDGYLQRRRNLVYDGDPPDDD